MVDYGYGCMVYWNLRQAHLQEVGMTKILVDHDFFSIFSNKTNFRTYCRANSKIDSKLDSWTNSMIDKHHQIIFLN